MRLTCSKCDAMYEVDTSIFSSSGREVRCDNCGHIWYQMPAAPVRTKTMGSSPAIPGQFRETADPQSKLTGPSPDVVRVLREEAERETRARKAEAEAAGELVGSGSNRIPGTPEIPVPRPDPCESDPAPQSGSDSATNDFRSSSRVGALLSGLVVLTLLGAVLVYSFAPQIIQLLPQLEPQLIAYVESANELRTRIRELVEAVINAVRDIPALSS